MQEIEETTYIRRDGSKFIRTRIWYEVSYEKPLHEFIGELELILLSIPLEFRSEAIFAENNDNAGYEGIGGHLEIYYDRDVS